MSDYRWKLLGPFANSVLRYHGWRYWGIEVHLHQMFLPLQEYHGSVNEVVYCCIRRCLCYPLYRHWGLAQIVLQDTRQLFHLGIFHTCSVTAVSQHNLYMTPGYLVLLLILGRRKLLQCLLQVHKILSTSEPYYILNNLFITDYCVWIQHARYLFETLAVYLLVVVVLNSCRSWLKHWTRLLYQRMTLAGS